MRMPSRGPFLKSFIFMNTFLRRHGGGNVVSFQDVLSGFNVVEATGFNGTCSLFMLNG